MKDLHTLLIDLAAYEMFGKDFDANKYSSAITEETIKKLYTLSDAQDISHVIGRALANKNFAIPEEVSLKFSKAESLAMYRYLQMTREVTSLSMALEEAKIPHILLKGSVLRKFYPEPWMRTSCDIDVLVKEEDLDRGVNCLTKELDYKFERRCSHDVSLYSPSGVHVELHFTLIEDGESAELFENIWSYVHTEDGYEYRQAMTPEIFVTYHVAHMAKHFYGGGCGVRPFFDLWVMKKRMGYDEEKADSLLTAAGLLTFKNSCDKLSDIWCGDGVHNEITSAMQNYLLSGGIYGNIENSVAIKQVKSGGKFKYILGRIFLPYSKLKAYYPKLEKYPILIPYYQFKRWIWFLKRKDKKRAFAELSYTKNVSEEKSRELTKLMDSLGLK